MKPRSKCAGTVPASFEIGLGLFGWPPKITTLKKRAARHFGPFFQPSTKALQDPSFGRPTPPLNQQTGSRFARAPSNEALFAAAAV